MATQISGDAAPEGQPKANPSRPAIGTSFTTHVGWSGADVAAGRVHSTSSRVPLSLTFSFEPGVPREAHQLKLEGVAGPTVAS